MTWNVDLTYRPDVTPPWVVTAHPAASDEPPELPEPNEDAEPEKEPD